MKLLCLPVAAVLGACAIDPAAAAAPVAVSLTPDYTFSQYSGSTPVGAGQIDIDRTLFFIPERAAAGVQSWLVFFEPASGANVSATLDFGAPIITVFSTSADIATTTPTYGAANITYANRPFTGLEGADTLAWTAGADTLALNWNAIHPGDHVRVLTALELPEPSAHAMLVCGLLVVAWLSRRGMR